MQNNLHTSFETMNERLTLKLTPFFGKEKFIRLLPGALLRFFTQHGIILASSYVVNEMHHEKRNKIFNGNYCRYVDELRQCGNC